MRNGADDDHGGARSRDRADSCREHSLARASGALHEAQESQVVENEKSDRHRVPPGEGGRRVAPSAAALGAHGGPCDEGDEKVYGEREREHGEHE